MSNIRSMTIMQHHRNDDDVVDGGVIIFVFVVIVLCFCCCSNYLFLFFVRFCQTRTLFQVVWRERGRSHLVGCVWFVDKRYGFGFLFFGSSFRAHTHTLSFLSRRQWANAKEWFKTWVLPTRVRSNTHTHTHTLSLSLLSFEPNSLQHY